MAEHTGFIAAAYAVTGLVLAGMILGVLIDHRSQRRALARLTAQLGRREGRSGMPMEGSGDDEP